MWNGTAEILKAKPTIEQPDGQQCHRRGLCGALLRHHLTELVEPGRAGYREGERHAVEEERARERTEQEVLERRLRARRAHPPDAGEHVNRQRQHFERQEDDEQIGRCRHQHHAADRKERQRVVLARRQLLALDDVIREEHRQHADDAQDEVDEEREIVRPDDAEALRVAAPEEHAGERRTGEANQSEPGNRHALAALAKRLGNHRGAAGQDDDDDRDDGGEVAHWLRSEFVVRGSWCEARRSEFAVTASPLATRGSRCASRASPAGPRSSTRTRAGWLPVTRSISLLTAGSIGFRKIPGATPMKMASATVGPSRAHSRSDKSGRLRFFSLVIAP